MDLASNAGALCYVHRTAHEFLTSEQHPLKPLIDQDETWNAAEHLAKAHIRSLRYANLISDTPHGSKINGLQYTSAPIEVMKYLALAETQVCEEKPQSFTPALLRLVRVEYCRRLMASVFAS